MVYYESNYLCHYGLKGMKWGQRRWQNDDGTFNEAGKARYFSKSSSHRPISVMKLQNDPDVQKRKAELKQAKANQKAALKAYSKASAGGLMTAEKEQKDLIRANNAVRFAKHDLSDEKAKKRMESDTRPKSKRRLKLEEEYKAKGMTEGEAELAAYKRARTEKALKIAAGVAVTAAVAYGASKYIENNVDRVIKSDVTLSRVATSDTASVQDAFYAVFSKNKSDVSKYSGLYAKQLREGAYGQVHDKVFQKTIRATGDIRMASPKSAMKSLKSLVDSDPQYKADLVKVLQAHGNYAEASAVASGKVTRSVYERMNQALGSSAKNTEVAKKFYDDLTSKGYNAIKDVNDNKFSGFMTKTPLIVFNAQSKVSVDSVKKLNDSEIITQNAKAMADIGRKQTAKTIAENSAIPLVYLGAVGGLVGASKSAQNKKEQQVVAEYKKEHPGSKLSYKDIIRNYYNQ